MRQPHWGRLHCALASHKTYAPDEPALAARLSATTPLGTAWRCLRCGDYRLGHPDAAGPAKDAPAVPHGPAVRNLWLIRALAIERFVKGAALLIGAFTVWRFLEAQNSFEKLLHDELVFLAPATERIGWTIEDSTIWHWATSAATADPGTLKLVALALVAYAAVQWAESIGLWLDRRWGEYLAVIATSAFLPLEVFELTEKITWLRVVMLLVNMAAVVWLVRTKRLFGVHGGATAYAAVRHGEGLLAVELTASRREASTLPEQARQKARSATSSSTSRSAG